MSQQCSPFLTQAKEAKYPILNVFGRTYYFTSCFILVVTLLGLALVCSCSEGDQSLEGKRQYAIQVIEQYHSASKNPFMAKSAHDVLSALRSSSVASLKRPPVACAEIVQDEKRACRLHLYWIEDSPSIDSVELKHGDNHSIIFQIPDTDVKANRNESQHTVVFTTGYNWDGITGFAEEMSHLDGATDLSVRLLLAGKPVTGWAPVDFYKVDRWLPR